MKITLNDRDGIPFKLYQKLLEALNCPHSLAIYIRISNADFSFLNETLDPLAYNDPRDYALARQAHDFLKKSPSLSSKGREDRTYEAFQKAEDLCRLTNERIRNNHSHGWAEIQSIARRKIASILGRIPENFNFSFGPGVSTGVRSDDSSSYVKYDKVSPHITKRASRYVDEATMGTMWINHLLEGDGPLYTIRNSSRMAQVPKNFKVNRTIATEPDLNMYFQKGIGSYIRDRLKLHGIDLRDQTVNQFKARHAISLGYATVDFSMASDTIAYNTVLDLLPFDWFFLLDEFRTPAFEYKNEVIKLQKFSSMGNGFTFELESLIFFAIAYAVTKLGTGLVNEISVYGDDVIIHKDDFPVFKECCEYYGFSINTEKTYISGVFFESCGKDYFQNVDVRPIYLSNFLSDDYDIFTCRNHLLVFLKKWKCSESPCDFLETCVRHIRHLVVPYPYSGGLWPRSRADHNFLKDCYGNNGWDGYMCRCLVFKPDTRRNTQLVPAILYSFDSAGASPTLGLRTLRRRGRYSIKRTFFPMVLQ